jgi:hypothetical protein
MFTSKTKWDDIISVNQKKEKTIARLSEYAIPSEAQFIYYNNKTPGDMHIVKSAVYISALSGVANKNKSNI